MAFYAEMTWKQHLNFEHLACDKGSNAEILLAENYLIMQKIARTNLKCLNWESDQDYARKDANLLSVRIGSVTKIAEEVHWLLYKTVLYKNLWIKIIIIKMKFCYQSETIYKWHCGALLHLKFLIWQKPFFSIKIAIYR